METIIGQAISTNKRHEWLILSRQWDETPTKVALGALRPTLIPWMLARLRRLRGRRKLSQAVHDSLSKLTLKVDSIVAQVIAQRISIRLSSAQRQQLVTPPLLVQRTNANCLLKALEAILPSLAPSNLPRLLQHVRQVVLILTRDGAQANTAVVARIAATAPGVLLLDQVCDIHRLHLVLSSTLAAQRVVGPLYGLAHLLRLGDFWLKLMAGVAHIVLERLIVVRGTPDKGHQALSRSIVQATLLRHQELTRARVHPASAIQARPAPQATQSAVEELLAVANGDWFSSTPMHVCPGPDCCPSRQHSVERFLHATFTFLMSKPPPLPALNRWHTVTLNASWFGGGFMFHNLLSQAVATLATDRKMGDPDDTDDDQPDADNYAAVVTKRLFAGVRFCTEETSKRRTIITTLVSVPFDALMALISSTDGQSGQMHTVKPILLLMVDGPDCLLHKLQADLACLLGPISLPSQVLSKWLAVEPTSEAMEQAHQFWGSEILFAVLSLAAGVFLRLELPYSAYPFKLWTLVTQKTLAVASQIIDDPACCKDKLFTQPFLRGAAGQPGFLLQPETQSFLQNVAEEMDTHIANVERSHASHKVHAGRAKGRPTTSFERTHYSSVLRQFMAHHLRAGGEDRTRLSPATLLKQGLPTARSQKRCVPEQRRRVGSNPLLFYIRKRRLEDQSLPRRDLAQEFQCLSDTERLRWQAAFRRDQASRRGQVAAASHRKSAQARQAVQGDRRSQQSLWTLSAHGWPLAPNQLAAAMASPSGLAQGLRARSMMLRPTCQAQMVIPDTPAPKAPAKANKTCFQLHPGLCRHGITCSLVAQVSAHITQWAISQFVVAPLDGPGLLRRFVRVASTSNAGEPVKAELFYAALVRKAPQLTVFARLVLEDVDCGAPGRYTFKLAGSGGVCFVTSYGLAQEFLFFGTPPQLLDGKIELTQPEARNHAFVVAAPVAPWSAPIVGR